MRHGIPMITSGRLEVFGASIAYDIVGIDDGRLPILLLHGNGEDRYVFDECIAGHERCFIRIDSRGQGESTGQIQSYEQMADDTFAVLKALDVKRCSVIGFSDGAVIALLMALSQDIFDKIVIIGANLNPCGLHADVLDDMRKERDRLALTLDERGVQLFDLMLTQPDIDPKHLGSICANEVYVVVGDRDMIRFEHTQLIASSIPGAKMVVVENAGHMLPAERPDQISKIITYI